MVGQGVWLKNVYRQRENVDIGVQRRTVWLGFKHPLPLDFLELSLKLSPNCVKIEHFRSYKTEIYLFIYVSLEKKLNPNETFTWLDKGKK